MKSDERDMFKEGRKEGRSRRRERGVTMLKGEGKLVDNRQFVFHKIQRERKSERDRWIDSDKDRERMMREEDNFIIFSCNFFISYSS